MRRAAFRSAYTVKIYLSLKHLPELTNLPRPTQRRICKAFYERSFKGLYPLIRILCFFAGAFLVVALYLQIISIFKWSFSLRWHEISLIVGGMIGHVVSEQILISRFRRTWQRTFIN